MGRRRDGVAEEFGDEQPRVVWPGDSPRPRFLTEREATLRHQDAAGEEDQSVPGWDDGA